jgi:hypothetical protein
MSSNCGLRIEARSRHLLLLALLLSACDPSPHETATLSASPLISAGTPGWVSSDDGRVSLRVTPRLADLKGDEPVVLRLTLRNDTNETLGVLRPAGDSYHARIVGTELIGPTGPLGWMGPRPKHRLGSSAFAKLAPGEQVSDELELSCALFPGSEQPGDYRIRFTYSATDAQRVIAASRKIDQMWTGEIESKELMVRRSKLPVDWPKTDPQTIIIDLERAVLYGRGRYACVNSALVGQGLGSVRVHVLGRDGDQCVFDVTHEIEMGFSTRRYRLLARNGFATVKTVRMMYADASFPLGGGELVESGHLHFRPGRWEHIWADGMTYQLSYLDIKGHTPWRTDGTRQLTVRCRLFADDKFVQRRSLDTDKTVTLDLDSPDMTPELAWVVARMPIGAIWRLHLREETAGPLKRSPQYVHPAECVYVEFECLAAK